jgi:hypothetical protein
MCASIVSDIEREPSLKSNVTQRLLFKEWLKRFMLIKPWRLLGDQPDGDDIDKPSTFLDISLTHCRLFLDVVLSRRNSHLTKTTSVELKEMVLSTAVPEPPLKKRGISATLSIDATQTVGGSDYNHGDVEMVHLGISDSQQPRPVPESLTDEEIAKQKSEPIVAVSENSSISANDEGSLELNAIADTTVSVGDQYPSVLFGTSGGEAKYNFKCTLDDIRTELLAPIRGVGHIVSLVSRDEMSLSVLGSLKFSL